MKCYVIERGEYSDRYIDAIFTTQELAEAYIAHQRTVAYDGYLATVAQDYAYELAWVASGGAIKGGLIEGRALTLEEFTKGRADEWGYVTEYDLWDGLPVVPA